MRTNIWSRGRAFTLVELLVVVSIIVILLALMVPGLSGARRVSRTVACAANLHSITLSMNLYATEWQGAILGGPQTSSRHLFSATKWDTLAPGISEASNVPDVISVHDWMSPTASIMGIYYDHGGTKTSRITRFMQFNSFKGFLCPENDLTATAYTGDNGPNFPVHRPISYNVALAFLYVDAARSDEKNNNQAFNIFSTVKLSDYKPRVQLVGDPSSKVFVADAARWYNASSSLALDTNGTIRFDTSSSPGSMTSDWGPWDAFNRAYQWGGTKLTDARPAAMRHGSRAPSGSYASFKFNMGFFDGHVETKNGLEGSDPSLWVPTRSTIKASECVTRPEFVSKYCPGGRDPVIR